MARPGRAEQGSRVSSAGAFRDTGVAPGERVPESDSWLSCKAPAVAVEWDYS